jgi:low affinity Fe/Cu permease
MAEQKVKLFDRFAEASAGFVSRTPFFVACVLLVVLWAPSFWLFPSVDTWQLVINTATTIVTFLMVFVIQDTQNRDGEAIQIKLDELIRAIDGAHNSLLDLEELTEGELDKIRKTYIVLAEEARAEIRGEAD